MPWILAPLRPRHSERYRFPVYVASMYIEKWDVSHTRTRRCGRINYKHTLTCALRKRFVVEFVLIGSFSSKHSRPFIKIKWLRKVCVVCIAIKINRSSWIGTFAWDGIDKSTWIRILLYVGWLRAVNHNSITFCLCNPTATFEARSVRGCVATRGVSPYNTAIFD